MKVDRPREGVIDRYLWCNSDTLSAITPFCPAYWINSWTNIYSLWTVLYFWLFTIWIMYRSHKCVSHILCSAYLVSYIAANLRKCTRVLFCNMYISTWLSFSRRSLNKMANIVQTSFPNAFSCTVLCILIQISLKFGFEGANEKNSALAGTGDITWTNDQILRGHMVSLGRDRFKWMLIYPKYCR